MADADVPKNILILGAGVFGLSTALTLLDRSRYSNSHITILDSAEALPNPVGSSVDSSRIIRADYANIAYAKLAVEAQEYWRDQTPTGWGGEGRYAETGFVLTAKTGADDYVIQSMLNVQHLAAAGLPLDPSKIEQLNDEASINRATGYGYSGDTGYANWNSGWADAEASIAFALRKINAKGGNRVSIRPGSKASSLLFSDDGSGRCTGVRLADNSTIDADLTIVACGAWSPTLLNLSGRCVATGQALAYLDLTDEEAAALKDRPTVINWSTGVFMIPPRGKLLKVAQHAFGYQSPREVSVNNSKVTVSIPHPELPVPEESNKTLRAALHELFPPSSPHHAIATRPFTHTRLCYYTDTPTGNFLICYVPSAHVANKPQASKSLFVATGGAGHGFKFLPMLGEKIVDAIEGTLEPELAKLWRWKSDDEVCQEIGDQDLGTFWCEDGSRGGEKGWTLNVI